MCHRRRNAKVVMTHIHSSMYIFVLSLAHVDLHDPPLTHSSQPLAVSTLSLPTCHVQSFLHHSLFKPKRQRGRRVFYDRRMQQSQTTNGDWTGTTSQFCRRCESGLDIHFVPPNNVTTVVSISLLAVIAHTTNDLYKFQAVSRKIIRHTFLLLPEVS